MLKPLGGSQQAGKFLKTWEYKTMQVKKQQLELDMEQWTGSKLGKEYDKAEHVKWVQLCGGLNIHRHCPSLGLEWKVTFSSPVATAEIFKFAGILS